MKSAKLILLICNLFSFLVLKAQNLNNATNGLTKSVNTVLLGGTLTQATSVDLGTSFTFKFSKGSSNFLFLDNSGNVGIGIGTPTAKFHTNGSVRFQGLSTNNTLTNILVADAGGNLSLRDASTLGGSGNFILNQYTIKQTGNAWIDTFKSTINIADTARVKYISQSSPTLGTNFIILNNYPRGLPYMNFTLGAGGPYSGSLDLQPTGTGNGMMWQMYAGDLWLNTWSSGDIRIWARNSANKITLESTKTEITGRTLVNGASDDNVTALQVNGSAKIISIPNAFVDPDKLLVSEGGIVKYMTKAQLGIGTGGGGTNYWTQSGTNIYYTSGTVGIGTTNTQGYQLAVNGDAIFTKIKVKQYISWPDYVFHSHYELTPLADLEKYLQKNKHLPDVPSASQIDKDGLDLGDNQSILLKKIEELTLYIIDINKKVEKLSHENAELRTKLGDK